MCWYTLKWLGKLAFTLGQNAAKKQGLDSSRGNLDLIKTLQVYALNVIKTVTSIHRKGVFVSKHNIFEIGGINFSFFQVKKSFF